MTYNRSVIVTGGTANLGYHTALKIAKAHPDYLVVIASRTDKDSSAQAINKNLNQENTVFMQLDLASEENVRSFAQKWIAGSTKPPIQALVLNAGLQFPDGPLGHIGHSLLCFLLLPHLAASARIVLTSSGTHDPAQKTWLPDAEYTTAEDLAHPPESMVNIPGKKRYTTSKLCNVLFAYVLSRKLTELGRITVNTMDPGLMPGTGLARAAPASNQWVWNVIFPKITFLIRLIYSPNVHTSEESAIALSRLAVGADVEGTTGKYFEGLKEIKSSKDSYDESKQEELWTWTVNHLAQNEVEKTKFESLR